MANGDKLTGKQQRAIISLLTSPTIAKAAETAGVGLRTLQGWLKLPHFARAYSAARQAALDGALVRFQVAMAQAVAVLEKGLKARHEATRIRVADIFLRHALKAIDQLDILARVQALEDKLAKEP